MRNSNELLTQLTAADAHLKKLCDQHEKLEKEVRHYGLYAGYSASAALHATELKKKKLETKQRIEEIVRNHRLLARPAFNS